MKKFIMMATTLLIFSGYVSAQQTTPVNSKGQQRNEVKKSKESTRKEDDKTRKVTDPAVIKIKIPPMAPDTVGIPKKDN